MSTALITTLPSGGFQLLTKYRVPLISTTWASRNWSSFMRLVHRGPVIVTYKGGPPCIAMSAVHYSQFQAGQLKGNRLQTRFLVVSWLLRTRWPQAKPRLKSWRRRRR